MNPLSPALMTAGERLAELAGILAAGLARLRQRHRTAEQSRELSGDRGESCLHFPADQSRHGPPERRRDS